MKKNLLTMGVVCTALFLSCSNVSNNSFEKENVSISRQAVSIQSVTNQDIYEKFGTSFLIPEEITVKGFSVIDDSIGVMAFDYNGIGCEARFRFYHDTELDNIDEENGYLFQYHHIYMDERLVTVNDLPGDAFVITDPRSNHNGVCSWYDKECHCSFNLTMDKDADLDTIEMLANIVTRKPIMSIDDYTKIILHKEI